MQQTQTEELRWKLRSLSLSKACVYSVHMFHGALTSFVQVQAEKERRAAIEQQLADANAELKEIRSLKGVGSKDSNKQRMFSRRTLKREKQELREMQLERSGLSSRF